MKLELKTENDNYSNSFLRSFRIIFSLSLIIILCNIALKLGTISKDYKIEYNCRLLSVEKSKTNFKKISKILNLKNKQRILEFCREKIK